MGWYLFSEIHSGKTLPKSYRKALLQLKIVIEGTHHSSRTMEISLNGTELNEFNEFRQSDKSLKHEL